MEINEIIETLHPLERKVLPNLKNSKNLKELLKNSKLSEIEVIRALQWLENKDIVKVTKKKSYIYSLDKNGKNYLTKKLPELQLLDAIKNKDLTLKKIREKTNLSDEELNISLGLLKKHSAIKIKKGILISITEQGKTLLTVETPQQKLINKLINPIKEFTEGEQRVLNVLLKRKKIIKRDLITDRKISLTELGKKLIYIKIENNLIDTLTPEILKNKSWKNKKFRRYDIRINVPSIYSGKRHFVNQAKEHAKKIWLEMGFEEMSGDIINSSFWNFDALFTPQDHPVRDLQDTFFLRGSSELPNRDIVNSVKKQHEYSWNYPWKEKEARKLVLRTHTTVLSAQTLANLRENLPKKYFALGRNYRNETVDWGHLFEFNQTEGIVVDENSNFRHLLGYLKQFFIKMGYEKIRFRPGYFPYTEPSVEIDAYISDKRTWIELGGAGIFRPEVVVPLLGKNIPVLAWGPGFDRILMKYYNIKDIRDLYKNDLKQLKEIKEWI